jgi:magnesium chelatase family protein
MLAKVWTAALIGVDARPVEVECDVGGGVPDFATVGLAELAVKEARVRVRSAIRHSKLPFPQGRVTVNLAPADLRKDGTSFDLPVALAVLTGDGRIPALALRDWVVVGELSLDGALRPVCGVLAVAEMAAHLGLAGVICPTDNASEALAVRGIGVRWADHLGDLVAQLREEQPWPEGIAALGSLPGRHPLCWSDVRGHDQAKRALEVAAAGGHNIIMIGPPGSGKTMLARRLPTILPPLSVGEALDTTRIYSVAGLLPSDLALMRSRPFRAPHHTLSNAALVGGGTVPRPGEVSLAHHGVLFLDELPEFKRDALEVLRQPLEDGVVTIARVQASLQYPASFILAAAMNPCVCGYQGDLYRQCTCSQTMVRKYQQRISGPLLDRIDIHLEVPRLSEDDMVNYPPTEKSVEVRKRVSAARERQRARLTGSRIYCNAQMGQREIRAQCVVDNETRSVLKAAIQQLSLSARAYDRILKVARTIADLAGVEDIRAPHVVEAIQYRSLDRKMWI